MFGPRSKKQSDAQFFSALFVAQKLIVDLHKKYFGKIELFTEKMNIESLN